MAEALLGSLCPCLFPDASSGKKLMELTPCKGSTSDDEATGASTSFGGRAQGLLGMALAPVANFRRAREEDAVRKERAAALMEGTNMKLLTSRGSVPVRIALSRDSAMLTYQSLEGPSESGVISLAIIREVKTVVSGGILRSTAPVPLQWTVRLLRLSKPRRCGLSGGCRGMHRFGLLWTFTPGTVDLVGTFTRCISCLLRLRAKRHLSRARRMRRMTLDGCLVHRLEASG